MFPPVHLVFPLGCAAHDGTHAAREHGADTMVKTFPYGLTAIIDTRWEIGATNYL